MGRSNLRRNGRRINLLERSIDTRYGGSRPYMDLLNPTPLGALGGLGGLPRAPHQKNNARLRAQTRTPPEQDQAKRKKTPIQNWSDRNLRLRCKDKPKNNKPNGSGSGKKFVPWC